MNYTNYKISWVHLTSRIRQLIVAVLSVTFGISMYIFMNSFMNGVNDAQTEITFTSMSHIKVYNDLPQKSPLFLPHSMMSDTLIMLSNPKRINYTEGIRNVQEVSDILMRDKDVKAVSAQLSENVFFRNGVTKVNGVLYGVNVEDDDRLFHTAQYLTEGDLFQLTKRTDGIVLGTGLADKISAKLEDNISLTTSEGVTRIFKVVGLIETGNAGVDKTKAIISILSARQLLSKNRSYATEILANVSDYNTAPEIAQRIQPFTDYKVEPWQEGNSQLESANVLRDILAVVVSLTILIVAGFGIYNIMNMTVNEKMREIAILKAMGFGGNDIVNIFLTQSLIIGMLGGCVGLFLGYLISAIVDRIPFKIASLTDLPIAYIPTDYFMALFFGLIITFVAGYLPARRASKIDPVDILRG
ncbi:FtsX-like permease family protein [Flavobacterium sp. NRK F10]|uniref:ABC transporter permease n=1 Tax=Flavobacterium sp. NRK F10 TaxID=2954931 RepID=UPI0020901415|nr:FtsX-like permease family protein [Flavobacterium sp. NRK F10]MCO6176426.1 FtsX-like permease family protein [Flavobacterium sp. NRK F10]